MENAGKSVYNIMLLLFFYFSVPLFVKRPPKVKSKIDNIAVKFGIIRGKHVNRF